MFDVTVSQVNSNNPNIAGQIVNERWCVVKGEKRLLTRET